MKKSLVVGAITGGVAVLMAVAAFTQVASGQAGMSPIRSCSKKSSWRFFVCA